MSLQLNFLGSLNATSSPESDCGASPPEQQASPTIPDFGRARAHASLSARQAIETGLLMIGTFGRTGFGSSRSNSLAQSWASRLRAKTASLGSSLYALTWKERHTPGGASIYALRASGRPISASGSICAGWPTSKASDANGTASDHGEGGPDLRLAATLASWVSPSARDWKDSEGMATTRPDGSRDRLDQLPRQAMLAGWQAPTSMDSNRGDYQNDKGDPDKPRLSNTGAAKEMAIEGSPFLIRCQVQQTDSGLMLIGCSAETLTGPSCGQLDAAHSAWLQGIPVELRNCVHTAMRSISKSRRRSSKRSSPS
jgi:hypothetical protein